MKNNRTSFLWLGGFVGVVALLAAYVFWGTWSLDVVPVMPDETNVHPMRWSVVALNWVARIFRGEPILPDDIIWSGLLGSPYVWQEAKFVLGALVSGLALVYFLRGRGLSRPAAYGAGLLLTFCGYWFTLFSAGHAGWFRLITYCIFPFALTDRALERGHLKYWLFLGATVAWGLPRQPDIWLLFTAFLAVYFIFRVVVTLRQEGFARARILSVLKGVLWAGLAFALIAAPSFLTVLSMKEGREKQIAKGDTLTQKNQESADARWIFVTNWSLPPDESLEFVTPRVNGDTSCPFVLSLNGRTGTRPYVGALGRPIDAKEGNYRQHSLYVGWVTCLLALLGLVGAFRGDHKREVRFFALAALCVWMLSLGRYCAPAYRLIFALPVGDLIRCPVKWHHLTEFCLCVLAGFGLEFLLSLVQAKAWRYAVCGLVLVGAWSLVSNARLYCAPIDVTKVRATDSSMQMTILRREDFQNPQVQAMVKAGRIVSLANYLGRRDLYLVELLTPNPKKLPELPPIKPAFGLSLISFCGMIAFFVYGFKTRAQQGAQTLSVGK